MADDKGGRPTKMTDNVVTILETAFMTGANISEACEQAGITRMTYWRWCDEDDSFVTKMERAQEYLTEIARGVVGKKIVAGHLDTAKWWLERRNKEKFSLRTETKDVTEQEVEDQLKSLEEETDEILQELEEQAMENDSPVQNQEQTGGDSNIQAEPNAEVAHEAERPPEAQSNPQG